MKNPAENEDQGKSASAILIGVGLDGKDEHVRMTRGENFRLLGGSEETHERMVETSIKLNEKLRERGKRLEEVDGDELHDLMRESLRQ